MYSEYGHGPYHMPQTWVAVIWLARTRTRRRVFTRVIATLLGWNRAVAVSKFPAPPAYEHEVSARSDLQANCQEDTPIVGRGGLVAPPYLPCISGDHSDETNRLCPTNDLQAGLPLMESSEAAFWRAK